MKVLIIHCQYKLRGGEDAVVVEEMNLLKSNGIDVLLLPFSNDGHSLLKILQLPFNLESYIKTIKAVNAYKPDVVHIHNLHFAGSISVLYALKKCGVPIVFTLHNFRLLCPSGTLFNKGKLYLKSLNSSFPWAAVNDGVYNNSRLLTFWVGLTIWLNQMIGTWKMTDRYIVLTQHSKNIVEKSNLHVSADRIIIKPNFVSHSDHSLSSRKNNFLYVGRLSEEKGIDILLAAFKDSPHQLTIIGDGPLRKSVEDQAKRTNNITYLGFQNKDRITEELKSCTALVFPSVWYETFGLTMIEAFANSTPVIASNIGSASLLIIDQFNGLHFTPSDVEDLKAKLTAWQNLEEYEKDFYRKNARTTYENDYTPEKNFDQLISIYTTVIDEKKRTAIAQR